MRCRCDSVQACAGLAQPGGSESGRPPAAVHECRQAIHRRTLRAARNLCGGGSGPLIAAAGTSCRPPFRQGLGRPSGSAASCTKPPLRPKAPRRAEAVRVGHPGERPPRSRSRVRVSGRGPRSCSRLGPKVCTAPGRLGALAAAARTCCQDPSDRAEGGALRSARAGRSPWRTAPPGQGRTV